jgi:hypothetical protein
MKTLRASIQLFLRLFDTDRVELTRRGGPLDMWVRARRRHYVDAENDDPTLLRKIRAYEVAWFFGHPIYDTYLLFISCLYREDV